MKKRVLFICSGNSSRSQIAEGLLRHLVGNNFEAYSAGLEPRGMNPLAVKVMEEIGIDISSQRSKSLNEYTGQKFDYVITLCEEARESCPYFPGKGEIIHWDLENPAAVKGTEEERLTAFRIVRNRIKDYMLDFLNLPRDKANLRCPYCGYVQEVKIPTNSCLHLYECLNCKRILTPTEGSCCVICSYSDKNCVS